MKFNRFFLIALIAGSVVASTFAQGVQRPKLVVGIVIDQMRFDYLYRFNPYYGQQGFNRLMNEGSNFTFAHFNYVPTYTAPGHSSIYTGTTPAFHGIIGNDFYDRTKKKMIYCVDDGSTKSVGSNDKEGQKSPHRLAATTITDQLKLATNGASKVISISLKDRAAILPGGHLADAAYWYDNKTGDFISSDYYINALPDWVKDFNKQKYPDKFLTQGWKLSRPESDYKITAPDEVEYEHDVFNEGKTSFPHKFDNVKPEDKYECLETTPYGNELVKEMAKRALVNENLGKNGQTDFLAISFSSTDYVGHAYGTNAYETEDIYIRLDAQIAEILQALDEQVGKGNYLLFLTADHAGQDTPGLLKKDRLPVGELNYNKFNDSLKAFNTRTFGGDQIIENISNYQIFISRDFVKEQNINYHDAVQKISDYLRNTFPQIAAITTRDEVENVTPKRETSNLAVNGFNLARSGDLVIALQSGYLMNTMSKGTTHGTAYSYDTHVPILFYGWKVPKQTVNTPIYIVDIAATVADLIKITEPSGSMGIPLIK